MHTQVTVIPRAIVLFAVCLVVPAAAAQTGSMSLATPPQAAAPLQIAGAFFNETMLTVLLVNVSGRTVEQTTLGLVLGDQASVVPPVTRTGNACIATVSPDGFLIVGAKHSGFDKAASYFIEKGILDKEATVRLVHVRFGDGSEWAGPLEAKGRFEEKRDQSVVDKVNALRVKHFPGEGLSWAFPGPGQGGKASTCRK